MDDHRRDHVLAVDLSAETVERRRVPQSWLSAYLGGKGIGARYLYEQLEAGTDPLGPGNLLVFALGPLSGYLPGTTRYAAITKSPLTGTFLDSYSGGSFPDRLAGALPDCLAVLVTGRAADPVRLVLEDGDGRLEPAETWGRDTVETAAAFPDAGVACVGPAGEHRVAFATIASDGGDHHAGRGGAGAVMGAKRLKAVVARGDPPEPPAALERVCESAEEAYAAHETGRWQRASGTAESVDFANELGVLPTEGWQRGRFDGIEEIGVEAIRRTASGRDRPDDEVPGDFRVDTDDGDVLVRGATPMTLGAGLGIDDLEAVTTLGERCDRLGVDVIDAGNAVAWAIRAGEAGVVDCSLEFGDPAGAEALIGAIAIRDSGGEDWEDSMPGTLADGVEAAANRYGGEAFVPTVKAMALPSYDPRGAVGMALAYATSDRGGCHRRARPIETEVFAVDDWTTADRVRAVVVAQDVRSVLWSLVVDDFVGETMWDDLGSEWLAALDRSYTPAELERVGERIWTLVRLFNAREGFDRADDRLPAPLTEPVADGPAAGNSIDPDGFERLLDAYYRARGWGPTGLPTSETLERLGLADIVDEETPLDEPWA